jgi:hypothetical protein
MINSRPIKEFKRMIHAHPRSLPLTANACYLVLVAACCFVYRSEQERLNIGLRRRKAVVHLLWQHSIISSIKENARRAF